MHDRIEAASTLREAGPLQLLDNELERLERVIDRLDTKLRPLISRYQTAQPTDPVSVRPEAATELHERLVRLSTRVDLLEALESDIDL